MTFSLIAATVDKDITYVGVQNLLLGRPGASVFAPMGLFCQLADTLGDHGSSRKDAWGSGTR